MWSDLGSEPGLNDLAARKDHIPAGRFALPVMLARSLTLIIATSSLTSADTPKEFFEKKVRPLLLEHCIECHGAEKHKGGLRLDHREGWQIGGDSGPALQPGHVDKSLILKAVSYADRDLKMPPKQKLDAAAVEVLTQWIAQGAHDPRTLASVGKPKTGPEAAATTHWAYQPIKAAPVPVVKDTAWPRNDIDRFILATLEKEGLRPAPDASTAVLQRRLAYDLTGLPLPEDPQMASSESLLSTNAFAEHWAQHWLDASRFAESSGGGRTLPFKDAWRFRDYVIESIRNDVPLDRFITEQIAGDLLPFENAAQRRRQLTATGFLVLGPTNYEEQDKDLLRMDIVDEQLDVIGKSLLGMSISCARCHDHKFDPIPARDYYAMAGILRSTKVIRNPKENVAHWIDAPLPLEGEEEATLQQHEAQLAALTKDLDAAKLALKKLTPKREPKDGKARPIAVDEVPGVVVDDAQAKKVGVWKPSTRYPTFVGDGYLHDENMGKGEKTLTFMPNITKAGRYEVRFAYTSAVGRAENTPVHILHADGEEDITVDQSILPSIDGRFVSLGQFRFESGGQGYVMVSNEGTTGHVTADAVVFIPVEELNQLATEEENDPGRDPKVAAAEQRVKTLDTQFKKLQKTGPKRPEAMVVAEHEDLGDSPIHIRGNIRNLGQVVPRGYIQAAFRGDAPAVPKDQSGRVQLAQWITSPQNKLTARVLANRVWMHLFGEGLVRSADNFGVTGEKPSHPDLLDHLALKLMSNGWSLKKLISYIIESRTYAVSSMVTGSGLQRDPDNRLLWRQNRKRLEAGQIRDTLLATAGTLDAAFMGPNVGNAKAVDGNDAAAGNLEYNYVYTDTRRSVYTPAFRNKRLELFDAFDFNSNNQPIAKRNTSTVSPQALYLLNHEFVIIQSREAAKRLLADKAVSDDPARLALAYQRTLGRAPSERESRMALDFVRASESEPDASSKAEENWSLLFQSLFACVDFRHVE